MFDLMTCIHQILIVCISAFLCISDLVKTFSSLCRVVEIIWPHVSNGGHAWTKGGIVRRLHLGIRGTP